MKWLHFLGILLILGGLHLGACSDRDARRERQLMVDDSIRVRDSLATLELLDSLVKGLDSVNIEQKN